MASVARCGASRCPEWLLAGGARRRTCGESTVKYCDDKIPTRARHVHTLARTTHALARHACSTTLGERVCVCQGVSVCVLWPPSTLSGTLSTHLHSSTCPPRRRCMSLMSSRLSHSSTCPQRNPYTRRRLRCRHSDRQPGHLVILRYKRMRAVAYARCIALFVLLRAQHCL